MPESKTTPVLPVPACPPVPKPVPAPVPVPVAAQSQIVIPESLQSEPAQPVEASSPDTEPNEASQEDLMNLISGDSKAGRAIRDMLPNLTLGVTQEGQVFAAPKESSNPIAYPLEGKRIRKWLRKRALIRGDILKRDELKEIVETLAAIALTEENLIQVDMRVGKSVAGDIESDLGTDDGRRVVFRNGKAEVITEGSKTLFVRSELSQPMPVPADDGDWRSVLPYLNMPEDLQLLVVAYITYCQTHARGQSAYPILVFRGVQGTGKSFLCKHVVRPLIDNSSVGVQMFPEDIQHFVISCQNQFLLMFDNVRFISKRWSDLLCVVSTAGTVSKRKLFTDAEEMVMHIHRPIVLNGVRRQPPWPVSDNYAGRLTAFLC